MLDEQTLALLREAWADLPKSLVSHAVTLKYLEAVGQLIGVRRPDGEVLSIPDRWRCFVAFAGAINSEKFINAPHPWRHRLSTQLLLVSRWLRERGHHFPPLDYSSEVGGCSSSLRPFVQYFDEIETTSEVEWVWGGWEGSTRSGSKHYFPLYRIYERLGRKFTEQLYSALSSFTAKGETRHHTLLKPLAEFIGSCTTDITPRSLLDPEFTTIFWNEFYKFYVENRHANNCSVTTILTSWNSEGQKFIKQCLEPSKLFAPPSGPRPSAPSRHKPGRATNIKKSGDATEVKVRLVTHVPLNVTDSEAIKLLFQDIQDEIRLIDEWANAELENIASAVQGRKELAKNGTVRRILKVGENEGGHKDLTSKHNPLALANAAATFEHYGYQTNSDAPLSLLYPTPMEETAKRLGIPKSGYILPLLALLILDHPKITASFLENAVIFNKMGQQIGLTSPDMVIYLNGVKGRSGERGFQQIPLTARGIKVAQLLIETTAPLRGYLKSKGDDNWRKLLLTSGKSFGYPRSANHLSSWTTEPRNIEIMAASMCRTCGIPIEKARSIAERFSLPALRAQVGVSIYIDTGSMKEMAEAMGHADADPRLIEHYLPIPILRFFQERWIRIFQNGVVVRAMADSKYFLEASSFSSMDELHEFLKNHSYQSYERRDVALAHDKSEVIFGLDAKILKILIEIQKFVQNNKTKANAQARYWASITEKLITYIRAEGSGREDVRAMLEDAESVRLGFDLEALVYE